MIRDNDSYSKTFVKTFKPKSKKKFMIYFSQNSFLFLLISHDKFSKCLACIAANFKHYKITKLENFIKTAKTV